MIDTNEISKFLTPELCEDAGIIVIDVVEDKLILVGLVFDSIISFTVNMMVKSGELAPELSVVFKTIG